MQLGLCPRHQHSAVAPWEAKAGGGRGPQDSQPHITMASLAAELEGGGSFKAVPTPAPRGQVQPAGGRARGPVPDTLPHWLPQSLTIPHSQERSPRSPRPARDPGMAWGRSREARALRSRGRGGRAWVCRVGPGLPSRSARMGGHSLAHRAGAGGVFLVGALPGEASFSRNDGGGGGRPGPPRAAPPRLALRSAQRL